MSTRIEVMPIFTLTRLRYLHEYHWKTLSLANFYHKGLTTKFVSRPPQQLQDTTVVMPFDSV